MTRFCLACGAPVKAGVARCSCGATAPKGSVTATPSATSPSTTTARRMAPPIASPLPPPSPTRHVGTVWGVCIALSVLIMGGVVVTQGQGKSRAAQSAPSGNVEEAGAPVPPTPAPVQTPPVAAQPVGAGGGVLAAPSQTITSSEAVLAFLDAYSDIKEAKVVLDNNTIDIFNRMVVFHNAAPNPIAPGRVSGTAPGIDHTLRQLEAINAINRQTREWNRARADLEEYGRTLAANEARTRELMAQLMQLPCPPACQNLRQLYLQYVDVRTIYLQTALQDLQGILDSSSWEVERFNQQSTQLEQQMHALDTQMAEELERIRASN